MTTAPYEESVIVTREAQRLGRYELIQRLGKGGFAEAYLARYHGPDGWATDVCLKRVFPEHANDQEYFKPLRDEAVIMAALSHPNIPRVTEYGALDGCHFMVMTFVDGPPLASLLKDLASRQQRLPPHVAIYIMHKVLCALETAHRLILRGREEQVIHRDVTPRNILIDVKGHPFLIDFGILKAKSREYRTEEGMIRGTLPYLAPETIMQGHPAAKVAEDARTDVYQAGVVLYELLAGRHPYMADEVIPLIVKGTRTPLVELVPSEFRGAAEIVERMMSLEMARRPSSAFEAAGLLEPFIKGEFRAALDGAALVERYFENRPRLALGYERARDVNTATRVRERPSTASSEAPAAPESQPAADAGAVAESRAAVIATARTPIELIASTSIQPVPSAPIAAPTAVRRRSKTAPVAALVLGSVTLAAGLALYHGPSSLSVAPAKDQQRVSVTESHPAEPSLRPAITAAAAPSPSESAPPAPSTVGVVPPSLPALPTEPAATERASTPRAARPATVTDRSGKAAAKTSKVVVLADGEGTWEVWVDDIYMGQTPTTVAVAPGKHEVAIGKDQPTHRKSLRIGPQQTKNVRFSLEAAN